MKGLDLKIQAFFVTIQNYLPRKPMARFGLTYFVCGNQRNQREILFATETRKTRKSIVLISHASAEISVISVTIFFATETRKTWN